jgi:hypothetical protein
MAGISEVILDNIALDIDPDEYMMLNARRRGSVHLLVSGDTLFQDRGIHIKDATIQLSGSLTDVTTLKALWAIYIKTGYTFTLKDFKDNEFTVLFTPGVNAFTVSPIRGSNRGYRYTISLSIVSVEKWFGIEGGYPTE